MDNFKNYFQKIKYKIPFLKYKFMAQDLKEEVMYWKCKHDDVYGQWLALYEKYNDSLREYYRDNAVKKRNNESEIKW